MQAVTKKELCAILDLTDKTVDSYRSKGLPTIGEGRSTTYPVPACVAWLTEYRVMQDRASRDDSDVGITEQEAKVRKLIAEALMKEVELEQSRGVLVNIEDAIRAEEKEQGIVRAGLLSFPARCAPFMVQVPDENTARQLLEDQIHQLMHSIATQTDAPEDEPLADEPDDE